MPDAHTQILEQLRASGLPFLEHEHPEARTVEDLRTLGFDPRKMVKTLAFRVGERWILLALLGPDRLDYSALARGLGVGRDRIRMADASEVEGALGFEAGGVAPFALGGAELYADAGVFSLERIWTGMGRRDRTLELTLGDYLSLQAPVRLTVARQG